MADSQAARLGRATARMWSRHRQRAAAPPPATAAPALARSLARGARLFAARCGNVLARLGLQVSAMLYLVFAVAFAFAGWKGWRADHLLPGSHASGATQLELALALIFFYFGISSLLRAAARHS